MKRTLAALAVMSACCGMSAAQAAVNDGKVNCIC